MEERLRTPAKNVRRKLTEKQKRFAEEYLKNGKTNATKAALAAGYSEGGARQRGSLNTTNSDIIAYMDEIIATARARADKKSDIDNDTDSDIAEKVLEQERNTESAIATVEEIMKFHTDVIRGKIKDQFGLDAMIKDRQTSANSLYKMIADEHKSKTNNDSGDEPLVIEPVYGAPAGDEDE